MQQGNGEGVQQLLGQLRQANWSEKFVAAFAAIAGGVRDRSVAEDPELYYGDSAELLLLLERL